MFGRRQAAAAFRPSAPAGPGRAPSRVQLIALLTGLVVIAAAIAAVSFLVKPSKARSFNLFYGSMLIDDNTSPVAVDLASGKPTVRLRNAFTAVSAKTTGDLDVVPLSGGNTLMLNPTTGEFNMVDSTGFVVKTTGGGVRLPKVAASTTSSAIAAGDSAYVVQSGPAESSIYLVGQLTVASAIGANAKAKARAYATLTAPIAELRSPAASVDGDLWVLTGSGSTHPITQLSVPAGSNAGVTLAAQQHGIVSGVAAIGSATRNADGTGGDVAAVASANSVQVFAGATPTTLPVSFTSPVDVILAASNAQGQLVFLYHSSSGWSQVTAPTTGVGSAQISKLDTINPGAQLVTPAESDGLLYTMDTLGSGELWQVDGDGSAHTVVGATHYPTLAGEKGDLTKSEVVARGSRVIFNARANYEAEVVFSDGTHKPRVIDKHSAVQVDPSGATALADALARGRATTGKPSGKPTTKAPQPAQAINDKVDCKTTTQTPHIPNLQVIQRAARSVQLQWSYPLLDTQDCAPSTYVVTVKTISSGAPPPPSQVRVQGQNGVLLTGLFPATQYELTVTAYLNKKGTPSPPVRVTTGPEGPAVPTGVRATVDNAGNWTVSWDSCGGIRQGCVPAATWSIIPKYCDGLGLSNAPETLAFTGDPTQHSFSHQYPGSDALLGRALCFQVVGTSPEGTIGTASGATSPVTSWRPPNATALSVTASQPRATSLGGQATTSVDINLGANAVRNVGGVGATITFHLTGPGGPQSKAVAFTGRSAQLSANFSGITAGAQYFASATVSPPGHPAAAVTTAKQLVTTRADWPNMSLSAQCPSDGGPVVLSCTLTVRIAGLSSSQANGEHFDLSDDSGVVCGSVGFGLSKTNFDPASDTIVTNVNRLLYSGSCTARVGLLEASGSSQPLVFGGTKSPALSAPVDLGQASTLGAQQGSFSADWSSHDGSSVKMTYNGNLSDDQVASVTSDWAEQINGPDQNSSLCGSDNERPDGSGIFVDARTDCVQNFGDQTSGWTATVSYRDRRDGSPHSFTYNLTGGPPGFVPPPPCTVAAASFTATWSGTALLPSVTVHFAGNAADVAGCSAWSYTLRDPTPQDCSLATPPTGNPPDDTAIARTCATAPSQDDWVVEISYRDTDNHPQTVDITVSGAVPQ